MLTVKNFFNSDFKAHVFIDKKQNTWFKGREIAKILGYVNPINAILDHVPVSNKKIFNSFKTITLKQGNCNYHSKTILIDEPGLYRLIFGSKLKN